VPGVGEIVDQQHAAGEFALGHRDVLGHVEPALDGSGFGAVGTRRHDRQRLIEYARQHVAGAHATARQAQDLVELPSDAWTFSARRSISRWYSSQET
jgi:hypothetical protein